MAKLVISFTLDSESDKDVVRWLGRQENRSAAIREAIRAHLGSGGVTVGDVYQVVRGIEQKLERGAVVASQVEETEVWDEPPEAAAALDALAEL